MKQIISFSFTSYSLFPILAGIFYVMRSYSFFFFSEDLNYKCSLFFEIVLLEFGMFLSIILELINIYRQSTEKIDFKSVIKRWLKKYKEKKIIISMFLCGFFDFIGVFLTYLIKNNDNKNNDNGTEKSNSQHIFSLMRITEFFFVILLYYCVLKKKIRYHQYISLCFIIVGLIFVFLKGFDNMDGLIVILCIAGNFSYSCLEMVYNWLMESKFVSSYELVAISGFFGCIVGTIFSIIFSIYNEEWDLIHQKINYIEDISKIFSSKNTMFEVGCYVFFSLCYNTFHFLMNKHLSPTHRIISDSVSSIMTFIINVIVKNNEKSIGLYITLQIIGHILIIFGILVYNELMIIHRCGMDENTNKEIQGRATKEVERDGGISLLPAEEGTQTPNLTDSDKMNSTNNSIIF